MSDIPFPYPAAKDKAARARVDASLRSGDLFEWAPLKGRTKLFWERSAEEFLRSKEEPLLTALAAGSQPLPLAAIALALQYPANASLAPLGQYLAGLAMDGKCFAWPGKKKDQPNYWHVSQVETLSRSILISACQAPLKAAKLTKSKEIVEKLVTAKRLVPFAPNPAKPKDIYLLNPQAPAPFLEGVKTLVFRLAAAGVPKDKLREALAGLVPLHPGKRILEVLKEREPRAEAHFSVTQLRTDPRLQGMSKGEFDSACLQLWREGKIYLHYHDAPQFLAEDQRALLVRDDQNIYYIGISWRN